MERSWPPHTHMTAGRADGRPVTRIARLSQRSAQLTRARLASALLVSLVLVTLFALMLGNAALVFGAPDAEQALGTIGSQIAGGENQVAGRQASELFLEYLETLIAMHR